MRLVSTTLSIWHTGLADTRLWGVRRSLLQASRIGRLILVTRSPSPHRGSEDNTTDHGEPIPGKSVIALST